MRSATWPATRVVAAMPVGLVRGSLAGFPAGRHARLFTDLFAKKLDQQSAEQPPWHRTSVCERSWSHAAASVSR